MSTMRTLVVFVCAAGSTFLSAPVSAATRSASTHEARVLVDAAAHLTAVGVKTVVPAIVVSDDACAADPSEARTVYACVIPTDGTIVVTESFAADAREFAAALTRKTPRNRSRALLACNSQCYEAMLTALHELVHVHRIRRSSQHVWDPIFEEGLAEAIGVDQLCPFERRVAGGTERSGDVPFCASPGFSSASALSFVRAVSARAVNQPWSSRAARRWRLNQVTA
jgi:hypothetical protein